MGIKPKLFLIASFVVIMLLTACEDSQEDEPQKPEEPKIEYYIKYELKTSSKSVIESVEASFLTEKGYVTKKIPPHWEGTFGPFNKLETVNFKVKYDRTIWTTYYGKISTCRGNQPFILKAEQSSFERTLNMSYSITEADLK